MKLNDIHIEVLKAVKVRLELIEDDAYLCFCIEYVCAQRREQEMKRWYNRVFFWRSWVVADRWETIRRDLSSAVVRGIGFKSTFGTWMDRQIRYNHVVIDRRWHHNGGIFKLGRIAWLDRAINTGELK